MRIRDYEARDHAAVVALITTVLAEYGLPTELGGLQRDLDAIVDRYEARRGRFWVAADDADIVGTVAIRAKEESVCELKRLYVRPSHRGTGLGQRLYEHAEAFARSAGYQKIWLDSSRRFGKAHRLYERNGFTLTAQLDNDWEDNVYEKAL